MGYYSNNYCNIKNNYVIFNIKKQNNNVNKKYIPTIKVLKNILTRGNIVKPSNYLNELFSYNCKEDNAVDYLISSKPNIWSKTIKGSTYYNPALEFYNNFDNLFENLEFVKNLIIPEALISDITNCQTQFIDEKVDFYIPQIKLVIEIDGSQHSMSVKHDKARDDHLKKFGNEIIRFSTTELKEKNYYYLDKIKNINNRLNNSIEISNYQKYYGKRISSVKENLTYICRLEMIIIELLLNNNISLDAQFWNFNLLNGTDPKLLEIAYNDIKMWLTKLFNIRNIKINFPQLKIVNTFDAINIDIDIYERYNDRYLLYNNIIYSRTSYIDDNNYFIIESDNSINYNITNEKKVVNDLEWLLFNIFGFKNFKSGQLNIIINMLNLKETIGILPTGSGKSLCYQFSSLLQPSSSFIVCPLVSLIKDQYDSMINMGITNVQKIDSSNSGEEKENILAMLSSGKAIFTWISPERFQTLKFRNALIKMKDKTNVTYFIIDEVHCLSEWGHDFRIAYLQLTRLAREYLSSSILVGLTATLSSRVLSDIKSEFGINREDYDGIVVGKNFVREELDFKIYNVAESRKLEYLDGILKKIKPFITDKRNCALVFTPFKNGKRGCIKLAEKYASAKEFRDGEIKINYFSGSETKKELENNQEKQDMFKNDEIQLLFATKSFGMGIDKSNIRFTVHFGMASSVDSLYQEVGRAGRDGRKSNCAIIHSIDKMSLIDEINKNNGESFDINKFRSSNIWANGDVADQLSLFIKGLDNYVDEAKNIYNFYSSLHKNRFNCKRTYNEIIEATKTSEEIDNQKFYCENILYKLYLLGITKDWTIDYKENSFKLEYDILDEETIKKNLLEYIKKDDPDFTFSNSKNKKISKIIKESENLIYAYIKILCYWYYNNITYRKIKEICNLDQALAQYSTDDGFKKYLKQYYTLDDNNIFLDSLISEPFDITNALRIFYKGKNFTKGLITKKEVENISILLDRFIIENQYIEVYHLINYLSKLILNRSSVEMINNLKKLLVKIKDINTINKIIELLDLCDNEIKDKYALLLCGIYSDINTLLKIYEKNNQNKILTQIFLLENERIKKIKKEYL